VKRRRSRFKKVAQPERLGHAILGRVTTNAKLPFGATSFFARCLLWAISGHFAMSVYVGFTP
ncbi:MAG: hypothetical protein WCF50_12165, partial [Pseudolabrys sp.]